MVSKIGDLEFPDFSEEDRTMIIESMNFLKEALDESFSRVAENRKQADINRRINGAERS